MTTISDNIGPMDPGGFTVQTEDQTGKKKTHSIPPDLAKLISSYFVDSELNYLGYRRLTSKKESKPGEYEDYFVETFAMPARLEEVTELTKQILSPADRQKLEAESNDDLEKRILKNLDTPVQIETNQDLEKFRCSFLDLLESEPETNPVLIKSNEAQARIEKIKNLTLHEYAEMGITEALQKTIDENDYETAQFYVNIIPLSFFKSLDFYPIFELLLMAEKMNDRTMAFQIMRLFSRASAGDRDRIRQQITCIMSCDPNPLVEAVKDKHLTFIEGIIDGMGQNQFIREELLSPQLLNCIYSIADQNLKNKLDSLRPVESENDHA